MDIKNIAKDLYLFGKLTKEELFDAVKNQKITKEDYVDITSEECPEIPLQIVKDNKCKEIEEKCKEVILGGFKSSAKGEEKTYGSSLEDQMNMSGNALTAASKLSGVEGCQNDKFYYHASGEDFEEWTADEVLVLARDFKAYKETNLTKSKMLQTYIQSLETVEDVEKINWDTVLG